MNLLLLGLTIGTVGKLILGLAVLRVHIHIIHEHKIDNVVLKAMKKEKYVTFVALLLILAGYILEVIFYGSATNFLECLGSECTALINAAIVN